jgi:glycosyltransferase involved in cell wall biosynthesis
MKDASFLVFPTECYENFPMVILEAMATALPVIASAQGSLPEIVRDGVSGVLVRSRDPRDWAKALQWGVQRPGRLSEMGREGRRGFERSYSRERGYRLLMETYQRTIEHAARPCL